MGKIKERKQHVRMKRRNWDADFYYDITGGKSFIISEPGEISLDGTKQKALYGPYSPLYGTTFEDQHSFAERYRCECGEFKSKIFEGETCPICGKKVEYRDSDINVFGWISLGDHKIISPYYFHLLKSAIGKKPFPDIIYAKYKITTDGKRVRPKEEDLDELPSSIYAGIGVEEFYNNYEEILEYFKQKKKNKESRINRLIAEKRNVFISHIPVPSTMLRPQSTTADSFYYQSIDKLINTAYKLSEDLKNAQDVDRDYILQRLQTKVNAMWEIYFNELNGKRGLIRGEMLGGSLNFTSRNVIVPDPTLRDDEIDLSYNTFRELYKYQLIYYIMRLEDCTLSKAYNIWMRSVKFDERVYNIMQFIVKKCDSRCVINRNPTLNYYSILLMKIRKVKPDGGDYALSVPLSINLKGKVESIINLFNCWNISFMSIVPKRDNLLNRYNQQRSLSDEERSETIERVA